ncbi:MAG: 4-hydroxy-tetrahydrodipicolinate reductase, partial [Brevundimonas sp.]|uniref:4-hydroxy-tetrahydrodipicolinate reductase n=1 Tax=Brevundimonas sp. TaxID=1871086 RepID=UPI00120CF26D
MSDIFHAGISGARGRMGRAVSSVLDAREDVVVAARFDRGESVDLNLCDVIIDFSTPDASVDLARACAEAGGPALVIGSTGLSPEQEAEIEKAAEKIAIVKSGNFSLGVNILIGLVEHAALRLDARDWDIEVLETHHRRKADAPSGTALMLGEAAANGRGADLEDLRTAPYDGITGARESGKIGFASLRAG